MLLSQDEARFPMVPTLQATLGVKGHRPVVPTRDNKDLLYVFAVVNLTSAALHTNTLESPKDAKKKTGKSKTRRLQEAFAAHLQHVGKVYRQEKHKEVVQDESQASNCLKELCCKRVVDLFSKARDLNIDHVIDRCIARGLVPYIPGKHFA